VGTQTTDTQTAARPTVSVLQAGVTLAMLAATVAAAPTAAAAAAAVVEAMGRADNRAERLAPAADATIQPLLRRQAASAEIEAMQPAQRAGNAGTTRHIISIISTKAPGIPLALIIIVITVTAGAPLRSIIAMTAGTSVVTEAAGAATAAGVGVAPLAVVRGAAEGAAAAATGLQRLWGEPTTTGAGTGAPDGQRHGVRTGQAAKQAAGAPRLALVEQHEEAAAERLVRQAVHGPRAPEATGSRSRRGGASALTTTTFESRPWRTTLETPKATAAGPLKPRVHWQAADAQLTRLGAA
jgi:hypothetical protein